MFACAPAFCAGGLACVPRPAFTNARNRPTVTSYLSRRKSLTVAGKAGTFERASPAKSKLRRKVPSGTTGLAQQLSFPYAPHVLGRPTQLPTNEPPSLEGPSTGPLSTAAAPGASVPP